MDSILLHSASDKSGAWKLRGPNFMKSTGLSDTDFPGMIINGDGNVVGPQYKKPGKGMTLDYKGDERYRITQSKINEESGGTGFDQGTYAWFSKGPDKESTWFWGGQTGPRFQQFYSYVMRNSTRTVNQIFSKLFKTTGKLIGKTTGKTTGNENNDVEEGGYKNLEMKIFISLHIFAILSFLINAGTLLSFSFIIVIVWILKYAFMSKYSGPGVLTVVFDGFGNLGSILLRNLPFGGLIIGLLLFLIPGVPFYAALFTIPIWITFKTWFFYLFGYVTKKYGQLWLKNNILLNWPFLLFEILLINGIAIEKYWPQDNNNNPFLHYLMKDGFGKAIPAGAMLALIYSEYKKNGSFITPILFIILSSILTTMICKFN